MNGYSDWARKYPIVGKKSHCLANILLIPEDGLLK